MLGGTGTGSGAGKGTVIGAGICAEGGEGEAGERLPEAEEHPVGGGHAALEGQAARSRSGGIKNVTDRQKTIVKKQRESEYRDPCYRRY